MEEKLKKNLIIGGSVTGVVAVVLAIVLGITLSTDKNSRIGFFSNQTTYTEDGFNYSTYEAANEYVEYINDENDYQQEKGDLNIKTTAEYDDLGKKYVSEIASLFDYSDIVISSGFQVANSFTGIQGDDGWDGLFQDKNGNLIDDYSDKKIVLLDDTTLSGQFENAVSVSFASEGAGYLSAVGAIIYTEYDALTNHDGDSEYQPNIVMWGGEPYPTVYDFMSGFAQAIDDFNTFASQTHSENPDLNKLEEIILWNGGMSSEDDWTENSYENSDDPNDWYTKGFGGTGTSEGDNASLKTMNAINKNASVIFPIAGANTSVVQEELLSVDSNTMMLGVDTDGTSGVNNEAASLYLGSATKNLVDGGFGALWAIDDYDNDGKLNYEDIVDKDSKKDDGENFLNNWLVDGIEQKGLLFEGNLDNDGVGFTYVNSNNGSGTSGMNPKLIEAVKYWSKNLFGSELIEEDEAIVQMEKALDFARENALEINSEDSVFIPSTKTIF